MSSSSENDEQPLMNDEEILMNSLMIDYTSKISYTFTKQDYETFMKTALMHTFEQYNMKPRGNIARMTAAVHIIVSFSGFRMLCDQNPEIYHIFPDYRFEPSDLCYRYQSWNFGRLVWIMFSFEDDDRNLMKLSGIYSMDDASEVIHSTVLDLKKFASPLIECLHGAIADSSEIKIMELWNQVYTDVCAQLLAGLRQLHIISSEPYMNFSLARRNFIDYVIDQNSSNEFSS